MTRIVLVCRGMLRRIVNNEQPGWLPSQHSVFLYTDTLQIVANEKIREKISFDKVDILGQIKTDIGEQKIDLVITTLKQINNSAFLTSIFPDSVVLKTW